MLILVICGYFQMAFLKTNQRDAATWGRDIGLLPAQSLQREFADAAQHHFKAWVLLPGF